MSFNRSSYDTCAYAKTLQESTDPLDYNLLKDKYESCRQCPIGEYTNNLEFGIKTDVESDLKGQTRKGSKCPDEKFPAYSQMGTEYTPSILCRSVYEITPFNIEKIQTTGLKDLSTYDTLTCQIGNKHTGRKK
jgi:hypothetical protein